MFKFDFAISYAGEEVGIATDLDALLKEKGAHVFFGKNEKVYLLGKKFGEEFSKVFGAQTRFAVILVSRHYVKKFWALYEFNVASKEGKKRDCEYILPVVVDEVPLDGLDRDVGYIDLRKEGVLSSAEMMMEKLRDVHAVKRVCAPRKWVATFGVNVDELIEEEELPEEAPGYYPELCDWMEKDLMKRMAEAGLVGLRFLEDLRTGETFSLRVGFEWDPEATALDFGDLEWWEVLEVAPFESVYPTRGGHGG